ncbi:MSP (Major sperm protein) domain-containing protein [Ditylenchus destructor]|nr:MSP (Major sperm protein) domain-containing protein [Ditylenchus destructor]
MDLSLDPEIFGPSLLQIEPSDFITFKSDNLTSAPVDLDVEIKNTTAVRQVYKVKCTSNEIFRVRPPVAYLKPDEAFKVKFSLVSKEVPDAKKHFFAVYHISAPDANDQKTAKQQWTKDTQPEGVKRLPVRLLKSDGSPCSRTSDTVYHV